MNILQAMKDALGSLRRFTGEEGSTEDDFRIMDNLIVAIEEMEKAEPLQKTPHSYTGEGECWSCEFQSYEAAELHLTSLRIPRSKWQFLYLESELTKEFERGYDTGFLVGAEKGRTLPIPEGWKLVPIEPTPQMIRSGQSEYGEVVFVEHQVNSVYRDMLAAAPEYKP